MDGTGAYRLTEQRKPLWSADTVCDGAQGNIEPHAILGFAAKPAQAAWVTNRKRISGGADRETIEQAARRSAGALAGMGRLVTLEDFQRAVLASNRNIRRVKCLAHVDRYNRPREGALALAVLPREYRQGGEQFAAVVRGRARGYRGACVHAVDWFIAC